MIRFFHIHDPASAGHCVAIDISGVIAAIVARHDDAAAAASAAAHLQALADHAQQKRDPEAKASEDNAATSAAMSAGRAGDASRPTGGGGSAGADVSEGVTLPGGENPAPERKPGREGLPSADDGGGEVCAVAPRLAACREKPAPAISPAERDEILRQMWTEGAPVAAIAQACGLSEARVYQRRNQLKLPKRDQKRPLTESGDVLKLRGVTVRFADGREGISFQGRDAEVTAMQARLCACLLRSAPLPVDREYALRETILCKVAGEAGQFASVIRTLRSALENLGLGIQDHKGVGLQITGLDQ